MIMNKISLTSVPAAVGIGLDQSWASRVFGRSAWFHSAESRFDKTGQVPPQLRMQQQQQQCMGNGGSGSCLDHRQIVPPRSLALNNIDGTLFFFPKCHVHILDLLQ